MTGFQNYYAILNITRDASPDDVRSSFRKLAHKHHPDKNGNSASSQMLFKTILEAYETLISTERRKTYDEYLNTSVFADINKNNKATAAGLPDTENIKRQLNFVLWEIEDLYTKTKKTDIRERYNCYSLEEWLSLILAFLDRWVLTPAGYGDYFFSARQIEKEKPYDPLSRDFTAPHLPYTDYLDFFYQIRRRSDKFIQNCTNDMLNAPIPGYSIPLIEGLFETLRLSYHYLVSVRRVLSGATKTINTYEPYSSIFKDGKKAYIPSPSPQD